jgi:hypothetical protein
MRYIFLVMLALVSQCGNANAWGDERHKIVCEIAFRLAQPDTRSAVRKLIRSYTEFDTFSESCRDWHLCSTASLGKRFAAEE